VDIMCESYVRVWLAMDLDNHELEEVGEDQIGERPEWLRYELECMSWKDLLEVNWRYSKDEAGNEWQSGPLMWCIEQGIAPGQPFLVEFDKPHYSTSYDGETDVEYWHKILRVRPMSERRAATAFSREVDGQLSFCRAMRERRDKEKFLQRTDVASMFIRLDVYFGSNQPYWDDMCLPGGIRYSLCSSTSLDNRVKNPNRFATAVLACGEDDKGDHKLAMDNLVKDALQGLPGLTEEVLRKMPTRSAGW
jgi:hypothetical protein